MSSLSETAYAKLNLALHVRGKLPDGRHRLETVFAFCADGDLLTGEDAPDYALAIGGPFGPELEAARPTLVDVAAERLAAEGGVPLRARLRLEKRLPIASGIGGGSADAAAALRLLTKLWDLDPALAERIAPAIGADVPACLLSASARGEAAGDEVTPIDLPEIAGKPVLLVNPRVPLSTADVFARWDGIDHGPLTDWREGRNDLEQVATELVPQLGALLAWLSTQPGVEFVRMSGSGATCFALFESDEARDQAAYGVPREWWRLATRLR